MEQIEDDTTMATRLISFLSHEEKLCCKKRKWILRRWPEGLTSSTGSKKHPKLDFLKDKYIPSFLTKEVSVFPSKSLIERSFKALQNEADNLVIGFQLNQPSSEFLLGSVRNLSDLELTRAASSLLGFFKLDALKALLLALSGSSSVAEKRSEIEDQVRYNLSNMIKFSMGTPSGQIQEVAIILRDPNSILSEYAADSAIPLPLVPSFLEAMANVAFSLMEKLPIRYLQQVNKVLRGFIGDVPLSFERVQHPHRFTLNLVKRKVKRLLLHHKKQKSFPSPIYNALRLTSLSLKDLYSNDGGLFQLIESQSPVLDAIEEAFLAAFHHLKKFQFSELEEIYFEVFGISKRKYQKKHPIMYRTKLRRLLIDSLHSIYNDQLPDIVSKAVESINMVARKPKINFVKGQVEKDRIEEELQALLCLSERLEGMIWQCLELVNNADNSVHKAITSDDPNIQSNIVKAHHDLVDLDSLRNDNGDDLYVNFDHLQSVGNTKGMKTNLMNMEISRMGNNFIDRQEIIQEVERAADKVAAHAYILLGGLMEQFARKSNELLDGNIKNYLTMGLENCHTSGGADSAYGDDASAMVLAVVKKFPGVPECVFEELERRLHKVSKKI